MLSLLLSQEREIRELRELKAVGGHTPIKRNATLMQGKINTKEEYLAFCTKLDDETIYNQMVSTFQSIREFCWFVNLFFS